MKTMDIRIRNWYYSVVVLDRNDMLACLHKKSYFVIKIVTFYINLEMKLALSTSICGRLRWYSAANFCKRKPESKDTLMIYHHRRGTSFFHYLDSVCGEVSSLPLLEHVIWGIEPAVVLHLLQQRPLPWSPLEDPHQQPGGLHGHFIVQPLKFEFDIEDVGFGLFGGVALEGQLTGQKDVEENTQAPHVRLGESLRFLQNFRR